MDQPLNAPCGTNLEVGGQNVRLRMGALMLGIALLGTVALVQTDLHRAWRLALFLPFFMSAFGAWQGLFRTCPGLAMKGMRENASGQEERMGRAPEIEATRRTGQQVFSGAMVTAVFSTAVVMMIP